MCYMNKHSYHYSQWNCLKSQWSNIKYILSGTKTLIFGGMSRGPMKQKVKCLYTMNAVIFRGKWGRLACLRTQMAGASCCVGVLLQMGLVHFTKGQEMFKKIKHHLKTSAKKLNLSQKWHWFQVDNDPKHIAKLFTKLNQYQRKNIAWMKAWISSHKNPKTAILLTTSDRFFNRITRWKQIANNKTKMVHFWSVLYMVLMGNSRDYTWCLCKSRDKMIYFAVCVMNLYVFTFDAPVKPNKIVNWISTLLFAHTNHSKCFPIDSNSELLRQMLTD